MSSTYEGFGSLDSKTIEILETTPVDTDVFILGVQCQDAILFPNGRATRLILTPERIVTVNKGFISSKSEDYSLDKVSNIEFSEGWINSKIQISGSGFKEEFIVSKDPDRKFVSEARDLL